MLDRRPELATVRVGPPGADRTLMFHAYRSARTAGFSRREAVRVWLLLGQLSFNDPPTDTWGRAVDPR